jgi:hypothetical protein
MIELFGLQLGTVFQGGTLAAMLVLLAIVARAYIVGMPERRRAANEGKVIDNAEVALRFKEWRAEVHAMKNELALVQARLHQSDAQRARNKDRFNMVLFILRLVMAELRRIDPESAVIKQAEALLGQVTEQEDDPDKTPAVNAAEHTLEAAKATLSEVKQSEGSGK